MCGEQWRLRCCQGQGGLGWKGQVGRLAGRLTGWVDAPSAGTGAGGTGSEVGTEAAGTSLLHMLLQNSSIKAVYPPEQYRDDLGALWYADVNTHDGCLHQLILTPTRLK